MLKFAQLFGLLALLAIAPLITPLITPSTAQAAEPDQDAIHTAITRQLDAIKTDNQAVAFAIASPAIQSMFGDAPSFMRMVERGFPQIFRSTSHRFLNFTTDSGSPEQRVLVNSASGSVVVRYQMIEIDGQWRVNGCQIEKVDEA